MTEFHIFLVAVPGLEAALADEARERGFAVKGVETGGVLVTGAWPEVWRANLELRGCSKVLVRVGEFYAAHLAQLDKRARAFVWRDILRRDVPVQVEATCKKSKIYHSKAAVERIARAITEELGAPIRNDADIVVKARIENDLVTISIDTSGDGLHRRGAKQAMAKAPMRETMAALFLRQCGFKGNEPVYDPMCGSGTFVIEAAEIAAGLQPGRAREFAFEKLITFDAKLFGAMKRDGAMSTIKFYGSDRDVGAIRAAQANAARAGVSCVFERKTVSEIAAPEGPAGLVIMNPPYGARIGDAKKLKALYASVGQSLRERFKGWRVGIITNDEALARATGLSLKKGAPVLHGGIRVWLFQAAV